MFALLARAAGPLLARAGASLGASAARGMGAAAGGVGERMGASVGRTLLPNAAASAANRLDQRQR